jgi:hypothetical protein
LNRFLGGETEISSRIAKIGEREREREREREKNDGNA